MKLLGLLYKMDEISLDYALKKLFSKLQIYLNLLEPLSGLAKSILQIFFESLSSTAPYTVTAIIEPRIRNMPTPCCKEGDSDKRMLVVKE